MSTNRCHAAALRLLGYRFRGSEELRRKLRDKGFDADAITEAIDQLTREGWIDDLRFARELVRSRAQKGIGPKRIALELWELGIDSEVAREAMRESEEEPRGEGALGVARKRLRILARGVEANSLPAEEIRKKLLAYLLRQGYEYAAAREAVDVALSNEKD
ncbi:MAG TPA: regulatory protein RecX [Thermoanaerobaculia bacterium]|nr:regulatory protein RecX [Thermoanaerobaculia bacterium]